MLQETQRTPDYFASVHSPKSSVDSSPDSFLPVLPAPAGGRFLVRRYLRLDAFHDHLLHLLDARFVTLVERPLLDALGAHEFGAQQDLHVLAGRWLADAELFRDEHAAHPVFNEVAIHLRAEMPARALQPFQDLQPAFVRQGAQHNFCLHIDN